MSYIRRNISNEFLKQVLIEKNYYCLVPVFYEENLALEVVSLLQCVCLRRYEFLYYAYKSITTAITLKMSPVVSWFLTAHKEL